MKCSETCLKAKGEKISDGTGKMNLAKLNAKHRLKSMERQDRRNYQH
jgi:hypothetical protein